MRKFLYAMLLLSGSFLFSFAREDVLLKTLFGQQIAFNISSYDELNQKIRQNILMLTPEYKLFARHIDGNTYLIDDEEGLADFVDNKDDGDFLIIVNNLSGQQATDAGASIYIPFVRQGDAEEIAPEPDPTYNEGPGEPAGEEPMPTFVHQTSYHGNLEDLQFNNLNESSSSSSDSDSGDDSDSGGDSDDEDADIADFEDVFLIV